MSSCRLNFSCQFTDGLKELEKKNMRITVHWELNKLHEIREGRQTLILSKNKSRQPSPATFPFPTFSGSLIQAQASSQAVRNLCIFHRTHREVTQSNKHQEEGSLHEQRGRNKTGMKHSTLFPIRQINKAMPLKATWLLSRFSIPRASIFPASDNGTRQGSSPVPVNLGRQRQGAICRNFLMCLWHSTVGSTSRKRNCQ